jgi:hypothetical protein
VILSLAYKYFITQSEDWCAESVGVEPTKDLRLADLANLCLTVQPTLQFCYLNMVITCVQMKLFVILNHTKFSATSRPDYAQRHKLLGLCRDCIKPVIENSIIYCEYHREKSRIRSRKKEKIAAVVWKKDCVEHYGGKCNCCGERLIQFLTIDHKNGKGNEHRISLFGYNVGGAKMYRWLKKNNYPDDYEILCMNCNWGKRYTSICPHKMER